MPGARSTTLNTRVAALRRRRVLLVLVAWLLAGDAWRAVTLASAPQPTPSPSPTPRFRDSVEVSVVLVEVRAVDSAGRPILGLTRDDFSVEVDGREVAVDSAYWVSGSPGELDLPEVAAPETLEEAEALLVQPSPPPPPGRLLVLFFQKDLHGSRLPGLSKMSRAAAELLDGLAPEDHVAVLSFDTRLHFWLDFTRDHARARSLVERLPVLRHTPIVDPGDPPSLAAHLERAQLRRAASMESALRVLAEALEHIEGAKSVALFAWGMGRLSGGRVVLEEDYDDAVRAFERARVTVFSLDVTNADYHDLELGLKAVAADTGGFYARTHLFPAQAINRLERALAGYYVLAFEAPRSRGTHSLSVRLVGHKGEVMARPTFDN